MKDRIGIGVLCSLVMLFPGCSSSLEERVETRVQQLARMAEFGSVECRVKKVVKADDAGPWYKIGDRKILFTCTAYLKAGIDLSDFSMDHVTIDRPKKSVAVALPHARLLSVNMPVDEIALIYDQVTYFRSAFTAEERSSLLRQGEADIVAHAGEMGILGEAEANAEEFFRAMLMQMGFETVTITFK